MGKQCAGTEGKLGILIWFVRVVSVCIFVVQDEHSCSCRDSVFTLLVALFTSFGYLSWNAAIELFVMHSNVTVKCMEESVWNCLPTGTEDIDLLFFTNENQDAKPAP